LGIPEFWLTVIQNHQNLSPLVEEHDEEALMFLIDIALEYPKASSEDVAELGDHILSRGRCSCRDIPWRRQIFAWLWRILFIASSSGVNAKPGFKLLFHFCQNPFFYDERAREGIHLQAEYCAVLWWWVRIRAMRIGTNIQWKSEGQEPDEDNRHQIRLNDHQPSFFNFFSPPPPLSESQAEQGGEVDSEEFEELLEEIDSDLQAGENFKDDVSETVSVGFPVFWTKSIRFSRLCRGPWSILLTPLNGTKRIMAMTTNISI
jgi:nucleosome assembly protein 1-like 1